MSAQRIFPRPKARARKRMQAAWRVRVEGSLFRGVVEVVMRADPERSCVPDRVLMWRCRFDSPKLTKVLQKAAALVRAFAAEADPNATEEEIAETAAEWRAYFEVFSGG